MVSMLQRQAYQPVILEIRVRVPIDAQFQSLIAGVRQDEGLAWRAGNPDEQSGLGVRVSHPLRTVSIEQIAVNSSLRFCMAVNAICYLLPVKKWGIVRLVEVLVCKTSQAGSIPASPSIAV